MAAKQATPQDPSSQRHAERPTHLAQDLHSISSSAAAAKSDLSQTRRDTSLPDDVDSSTEYSVQNSTGSGPARNRRIVNSEINDEPSQPYQSQIPRALSECQHSVAKYRQAQNAPPLNTSREYNIFPSISYPRNQQLLCRWLYETANENMTMAEILEKSNWEEKRLEKL